MIEFLRAKLINLRGLLRKSWFWFAILALGLFFGGPLYQSHLLNIEAQTYSRQTSLLEDCDGSISIEIIYPSVLRSDGLRTTPQPLSVWLSREPLTPSNCPTLTPTPQPSPTPSGTSLVTAMPTATPRPYEIAFRPYTPGLFFVDEEGHPAPAQVLTTPGSYSGIPGVVYLKQASLVSRTDNVTVGLVAVHPNGTPLRFATPMVLLVGFESELDAGWRHRLDFLFAPAVPLLPLILAVAGYAFDQWHKDQLAKEKRDEKRRDKLAEIDTIVSSARRSLNEAVWKLADLEGKSESDPEWRIDPIRTRLVKAWDEIKFLEWQTPLLQEAATFLAQGEYHKSKQAVDIVRLKDSANGRALDLERAIAFTLARQSTDKTSEWLKAHASHDLVPALVRVLHDYDESLRELIVPALADLSGREPFVREVYNQLGATDDGRRILEESVFFDPLKRLSEDKTAQPDAKQCAEKLLWLRLSRSPWPDLWPRVPSTDPVFLTDWLGKEGLTENPFGPEQAELDRRLPDRAINDHAEKTRGTRPVVVFGESGSGRTATALLLAHTSENPPPESHDLPMFPIYFPASLENYPGEPRAHLETIARAATRTLLHLLAVRPHAWLELPAFQRESLGALLLTCTGSKEALLAELRRTARDPDYRRMARAVENLHAGFVPGRQLGETGWLDLLAGAVPHGFDYMQVIVDVGRTPLSDPIARSLSALLGLIVPLARNCIYLKVFAPEALRSAGDIAGIDVVSLIWDAEMLGRMLESRLQRASGGHLIQLCRPFVEAALKSKDPPRQLIRMGNRLFLEHARNAPDSPISSEEIASILRKMSADSVSAGGADVAV